MSLPGGEYVPVAEKEAEREVQGAYQTATGILPSVTHTLLPLLSQALFVLKVMDLLMYFWKICMWRKISSRCP